MRLEKVICGGQTGADQARLRAARAAGIPTGGFAPNGRLTEDGPAPGLAEYGLTECSKAAREEFSQAERGCWLGIPRLSAVPEFFIRGIARWSRKRRADGPPMSHGAGWVQIGFPSLSKMVIEFLLPL